MEAAIPAIPVPIAHFVWRKINIAVKAAQKKQLESGQNSAILYINRLFTDVLESNAHAWKYLMQSGEGKAARQDIGLERAAGNDKKVMDFKFPSMLKEISAKLRGDEADAKADSKAGAKAAIPAIPAIPIPTAHFEQLMRKTKRFVCRKTMRNGAFMAEVAAVPRAQMNEAAIESEDAAN